jgi:hypothetical protein
VAGEARWGVVGDLQALVEFDVHGSVPCVFSAPRADRQSRVQQRASVDGVVRSGEHVGLSEPIAVLVRIPTELAIGVPRRRSDRVAEHRLATTRVTGIEAGARTNIRDRRLSVAGRPPAELTGDTRMGCGRSDQGHARQLVTSIATTGPGGASRRYCSYLPARSCNAWSNSGPESITRALPSTLIHHNAAQSSA